MRSSPLRFRQKSGFREFRSFSLVVCLKNDKMQGMKSLVVAGVVCFSAVSLFAQDKVDFTKEIMPVLRDNCLKCHGPEKQKSKYRMDTKAEAFKGGKSGKVAVTPGKADESELIHRLLLPKDNDELLLSTLNGLSRMIMNKATGKIIEKVME